jgi:hypothetical protein
MRTFSLARRRCGLLVAAAFTALIVSSVTHAQALRVTAANSSNSSVYDVNFVASSGTIDVLNTDQSSHVGFRSLVFIPNAATGKIDLIAADTSRGEIVRYPGGVGTSVTLSTASAGPPYPDGLSVDGAGNLFVVSSAAGNTKPAQLWVLPRDPAAPSGSAFLSPRLVDGAFAGVDVQTLEESLIARTTSRAAAAGDLLVLASQPATVFVYSAASVAAFLTGAGPIAPPRKLIAAEQFPAGVAPGGMDFWPIDNTLLISTSSGIVLRYNFTAGAPVQVADFTSGLGNGKFKIKTGLEDGIAFAFVADNNGGRILKFGAPQTPSNPPIATVTSGVQRPQALTTTNLASTDASECLSGCDVLQGVIKHEVNGVSSVSGYLIEEPCVVQIDPRIEQYGTCTGHSLPVAQVCAGYGATVIPDYLCGGSGASGTGFALVKSTTNSLDQVKGALIANEAFSESVLSGTNPLCPQSVLGWAPGEGEGTIVEGNGMLELTGTCGSSGGLSRGMSMWGIGLVLNESALPGKSPKDALVNFAVSKYSSLISTTTASSIDATFRQSLLACIASSRDQFNRKKYPAAAAQLVACDALVRTNESQFYSTANNPNPSGEIRGRLANLYLAINTRIAGNPPLAAWPPGP